MNRARTLVIFLALLGGCGQSSHDSAPDKPSGPLPHMVEIPAGRFEMGAGPDADVQQGRPQHEVTVPAFRLADSEVTFDQYDAFAHATGHVLPQDEGFGRGTRPVINVTRADMLAYLGWLNTTTGTTGFRLPSEAEWEYAARAGTTTPYYWGTEPDSRYANNATDQPPDIYPTTAPAKSFLPNAWGLYDMAGNVWEATADCMNSDYVGAPTDGSARKDGFCFAYMVRSGEYDSIRRGIMVTARGAAGNDFAGMSLGFRVAQDAPSTPR
jgi:formylglycine-generating enzyme required for sulfatase activity